MSDRKALLQRIRIKRPARDFIVKEKEGKAIELQDQRFFFFLEQDQEETKKESGLRRNMECSDIRARVYVLKTL